MKAQLNCFVIKRESAIISEKASTEPCEKCSSRKKEDKMMRCGLNDEIKDFTNRLISRHQRSPEKLVLDATAVPEINDVE